MFENWSLFNNDSAVDYTKMVDDYGKTTAHITTVPLGEEACSDNSRDDEDIDKKIDNILYGLDI